MSTKPSGTLGGLLAGLISGQKSVEGTRVGSSPTRKVLGGALLAAGAAYLYKRYKNGSLRLPGTSPK